jgi:hypothetical protein
LNIASNAKIFPTGPPTAPIGEDPPAYQYGGNEEVFKKVFEDSKQSGSFEVMPMVPPKWEWISFNI